MNNDFCNNPTPLVTQEILKNKYLKDDPFFLVDVGASGGIGSPWHHLGDDLKAIAIDPLVNECRRLQEKETRPMVKYTDAFIVAEKEEDQLHGISDEMSRFYNRSSYEAATRITAFNFIKEQFNAGAELVYSDKKIPLNALLADQNHKVNFLKIDTDGYDICVLKGANQLLGSPNLIGVLVECQFLGQKGPKANTFSNIERYLAEFGYHVFNMDINRYSRHHLPSRFVHDLFAQTEKGQTIWADVLFLKDPLEVELTRELACKFILIHELFNLQDCAAEILVERSSLFDERSRITYLDLLAKQYYGDTESYETALRKYKINPKSFFPENYRPKGNTFKKWSHSMSPFLPKTFKNKVKTLLKL